MTENKVISLENSRKDLLEAKKKEILSRIKEISGVDLEGNDPDDMIGLISLVGCAAESGITGKKAERSLKKRIPDELMHLILELESIKQQLKTC